MVCSRFVPWFVVSYAIYVWSLHTGLLQALYIHNSRRISCESIECTSWCDLWKNSSKNLSKTNLFMLLRVTFAIKYNRAQFKTCRLLGNLSHSSSGFQYQVTKGTSWLIISALSHTRQGFLCLRGMKTRKFPNTRGSQWQVSVDICSVEGGSPWKSALGFLSRKRSLKDSRWENDSPWGFQKGRTVCIWQSKTSARIFGKKIVTQKVSGKFISDGIFSMEDFRAILKFQLRNPNTYVDQIKMQTCSQKALSKHTNYTGYKLKLPLFTY